MSVVKHSNREYSTHDKDTHATDHQLTISDVIQCIPDLNNNELGSILDLEVNMSIDIDSNIVVMRTK